MAIDVPDEHIFVRPGKSLLAEGQIRYAYQLGATIIPGGPLSLTISPTTGYVMSINFIRMSCNASCIQTFTLRFDGTTFIYHHFDMESVIPFPDKADYIITATESVTIILTNNDTVDRDLYVSVFGTIEKVA